MEGKKERKQKKEKKERTEKKDKKEKKSKETVAETPKLLNEKNTEQAGGDQNWLIHRLFLQQSEECESLIAQELAKGPNDYALYVQGVLSRQKGALQKSSESLSQISQEGSQWEIGVPKALELSRVARLSGRAKLALELLEGGRGWKVWQARGDALRDLGMSQMGKFEGPGGDAALETFRAAGEAYREAALSGHPSTYLRWLRLPIMALGPTVPTGLPSGVEVIAEALEQSPDHPGLLTTAGLLHLRIGEHYRAFDYLGTALSQAPTDPATILAAGSIIQDHAEVDVALLKYRIAAVARPSSAELWNNVGVCFFAKQKFVAVSVVESHCRPLRL